VRLRLILLILSLLAFLSAAVGGFLYYSSVKEAVFQEAERQAQTRLAMLRKSLSSFLAENIKPVKAMAGMRGLQAALLRKDADSLARANAVLDHFRGTLGVEVCYLMDRRGLTLASSNRLAPDSFVGQNFAFRPYFQQAIRGQPAAYLALGITSRRRGAYSSHPVYDDRGLPLGVAVIKSSIEHIEDLVTHDEERVAVIGPQGVVFVSNRPEWLYHTLGKLTPEQNAELVASRQFGPGPWKWTGLTFPDGRHAVDRQGNKYLVSRVALEHYPGWQVQQLRGPRSLAKLFSDPSLQLTGYLIVLCSMLVGLSVGFLYWRASREIRRRNVAEQALKNSERSYRTIYHSAPAMLHSIDPPGRLVMVSDHWLETLGYERGEVIGRPVTDFFSEASRHYAGEAVFPDFFRRGYCKDIHYQYIKKNGEPMEVLLSAIAERDESGRIVRSLAVSIDVTERKKAEEALKEAQAELSRYAQDLERQVRKRTREITSIFKYTPAVVFIKDARGHYQLVNPRFEELFHLRLEDVKGKTDHELFPQDVADLLRAHDQRVLQEEHPLQVEEQVYHEDGVRTYLSVKFPLYDEFGRVSGLCGISTDITTIKRARDQLKRLSGSIITNQENERTLLARELHDELGQLLTVLQMDCSWIQAWLNGADSKAAERARSMGRLIDRTIAEVHSLAVRLRPGILDRLGLVDALEWFTSDFEKRTGITCIFETHQIPGINDSVATAAYRIAQEALTNVVRHSQANCVNVVLQGGNTVLSLTVSDNGRGFDPAALSEHEGLGLLGMRERASLVGGELEVSSAPGGGTRVFFAVSLEEAERRTND